MDPPIDDFIGYWEERHATLGEWRSGGDRGLSVSENVQFYAVRLGKLTELIRRHASRDAGLRILDAGCGRGYFTNALRASGHRASGIDTSPTALAEARARYGDHFVESALDRYQPPTLYDVIVCIDVLFHIVDDGGWRAALRAFGRFAAAEALLVITDVFPTTAYAPRSYIAHRSLGEYDRVLAELDFVPVEQVPYQFGSSPIKFAAYLRRP